MFWHSIRYLLTIHRSFTHRTSNKESYDLKLYPNVDDILIIFDSKHTSIQAVLTEFNSIQPKLHFRAETDKTIQETI